MPVLRSATPILRKSLGKTADIPAAVLRWQL
jgi:hypothetical protein